MGQPVEPLGPLHFKGNRSGFSIAALGGFIDSGRALSIINFAIGSTIRELMQ